MSNEKLKPIQTTLIDMLLNALAIFMIPVVFISVLRFIAIGWKPIFTFHIMMTILFISAAILKKIMNYQYKVALLLLFFFSLGLVSLLNYGIQGFAFEFFIITLFLSITFSTPETTSLIVIVETTSLFVVGVLICSDIFIPFISNQPDSVLMWVTMIGGFVFLTVPVFILGNDVSRALSEKLREVNDMKNALKNDLAEIGQFQDVITICSHCKDVQDDEGYWSNIEVYISSKTQSKFSHGLCDTCVKKMYGENEWYDSIPERLKN